MAKDQFWFPSNSGLSVKITKWTGQEYIGGVHVSPQVVRLNDSRNLLITVENPYDDKVLKLQRMDKLACMSVMSTAIPRFSKSLSPDSLYFRYKTSDEGWFRATTALLHKKGQVGSISISPGKTMKIIATIVGPIKRFVDMEVLVTESPTSGCPIDPQVA